ncbi:YaaR family protein [Metabacillus arenae]|uniref:YaaR family protein n=1 Tax=Metabacillus arenae TaxID=2771434 RepID=A0A926NHE9_9BACI|nr:YaaR family protein [Metabacillus arenae]MBD1383519.1 YaaR family protein [Metabacillus arenae]
MKINQEVRNKIEKRGLDQKGYMPASKAFRNALQKQNHKLHIEQLNRLMAELETVGSRADKSRNFQDLAKFKSLVKRFIREAVQNGMNLKETSGWDFNGNSRTLRVVEQIDQQLIELTNQIVSKETESIDVLAEIGEIKGLLINLYT